MARKIENIKMSISCVFKMPIQDSSEWKIGQTHLDHVSARMFTMSMIYVFSDCRVSVSYESIIQFIDDETIHKWLSNGNSITKICKQSSSQ